MQLKLFSEQQSVCVGGAATDVGMLAVSGLETLCYIMLTKLKMFVNMYHCCETQFI